MFSSCKEMLDFTPPQEEDSYLYVNGDDVRFILLLY
jgi:hypothetical protein